MMELASKRKLAIRAYLIYVIIYYIALYLEVEPLSSNTSTIGLIGECIGLPLYWFGIRSQPADKRKYWTWFGISALLYTLGEILWAIYIDGLGIDPTSPSLCDVFYIGNAFSLLYASFLFLRQVHISLPEIFFDILISVLAISGFLFNYILYPMMEGNTVEPLAVLINTNQTAIDLLLISGLLMIVFNTDSRHFFSRRIIMIGISFLGFFFVDQVTLAIDIYDIQAPGWIEPFWSFPIWLMGLASMTPDEPGETWKVPPRLASTFRLFRILLPYIFAFSIIFLVGIQYGLLSPLFLWAVSLLALLSLRQIFVLLRNERLMTQIRENEARLNLQNAELQRLNQVILRDAEVDFLTQLANRRFIDQTFRRLTPAAGVRNSLGILLIDVDSFKRINDTYGHQTGDFVLQQIAACIRSVIRSDDIAGRFGGDEFIVLLPGADRNTVTAVAHRLTEKVPTVPTLSSRNVTLSVGCTSASFTSSDYDFERILKQADDALYRAKQQGRNKIMIHGE